MFWRPEQKGTDEEVNEVLWPYLVLPSATYRNSYDRPEFCIISINSKKECEIFKEFPQVANEKLTFIGYDKDNDHIRFMKHQG